MVHAGQPARAMHTQVENNGVGLERCMGDISTGDTRGEDALLTQTLVVFRAHGETDKERTYFLAPEKVSSKGPT